MNEELRMNNEELTKGNKAIREYVNKFISKAILVKYRLNRFIKELIALFTYSPIHFKKAFTLAEVLITLGIIGVVAAMTIPTLVQNYKKHEVETKLKYAYSMVNQAIKLSETEYGDFMGWDDWNNASTLDERIELFNKYIGKHIKVLDIKKEIHQNGLEYAHIYLSNGTILAFPRWQDISLYMDEKSIKNPKNGVNNFVFRFKPQDKTQIYHYGKGFEPYMANWNGTEEDLYTSDLGSGLGCAKADAGFCAKLIQINGWKIPKDYPLRF